MTNASDTAGWGLFALLVALLTCPRALAQGDSESLELGVGAQAGFAYGDVCNRLASDVSGCTAGQSFAGVVILPRWRFSEFVATGVFGAVSVASSSSRSSTTSWQLAAQLRWRPFGSAGPRLWLGPDVGVVGMVDESKSTVAPALGVTTGLAVLSGDTYEVDVDLRGFVNLFGNREPLPRDVDYGTQAGIALGASFALLF